MDTKICTSIEQSKKLLSLGLDPSTADMYYKYVLPKSDKLHHVPDVGEPTNALSWYNKGYTLNGRKEPLELKDFCIPCWSLAALLGLMSCPIILNGNFAYPIVNLFSKSITYDVGMAEHHREEGYDLIDAAVKTVVWLIEQGHIKVNK